MQFTSSCKPHKLFNCPVSNRVHRTHAPSCHTFTLQDCMSISPSQTHLRRLEGVVSRKVNVKEEDSSLVWRPCSRDMSGERTK